MLRHHIHISIVLICVGILLASSASFGKSDKANKGKQAPKQEIRQAEKSKSTAPARTNQPKQKKAKPQTNNARDNREAQKAAPQKQVKQAISTNTPAAPQRIIEQTKSRPAPAASRPRSKPTKPAIAEIQRQAPVQKQAPMAIADRKVETKAVKRETIVQKPEKSKPAPIAPQKIDTGLKSVAKSRSYNFGNELKKTEKPKNTPAPVKRQEVIVKSVKTRGETSMQASKPEKKIVISQNNFSKKNKNSVIVKQETTQNVTAIRPSTEKIIVKNEITKQSITPKKQVTSRVDLANTNYQRKKAVPINKNLNKKIGNISSRSSVIARTDTATLSSFSRPTSTVINKQTNVIVNANPSFPYVSRDYYKRSQAHRSYNRDKKHSSNISINLSFNNYDRWSKTSWSNWSGYCSQDRWNRWNKHWWRYQSRWGNYGWQNSWLRPGCGTIVYYRYGSGCGASYIYPDYHRKYVFVSIGGYWPVGYRYQRYYWYGCHPTVWYGVHPVEYVEVNNNYYGYDNYNYATIEPTYTYDSFGNIVPDYEAFAQVRERLNAQQEIIDETPQEKTLTDEYFDNTVKAFEEGDYEKALLWIRQAIQLSPEDIVLPFVYCQALLANEDYGHAASVLRIALDNLPEDKKAVFFPRGLYANEADLEKQIDKLADTAEIEVFNSDLQLLLGYELLGIGQLEQAKAVLESAKSDNANTNAANILLGLIEQAKQETVN